jgi:ribosomal protein L11 methyltransferase
MMPWTEVSLSIPRERAATVEAALQELGALAVTMQDQADRPVLEPAPGTAPLWPEVRVCGLFPTSVERAGVTLALLHVAELDQPEALLWREVADQVWERAWMDGFQPMRFGKKLWVLPSGMEAPLDTQAVLLRLDPGLAFGTGTHATTAMCLQWIDGQELAGSRVVDYGCGSGILGIACAMKGAQSVVCVDNDPQALEATAANAARNGVSQCIVCLAPEAYRENCADILLANILSRPLIDLAPRLLGSLRPGGHIVLSGILDEQAEDVARAYRKFCAEIDLHAQEGWVRLHGRMLDFRNRT